MWSLTYEDDLLKDNYEYLTGVNEFFTATTQTNLTKFKMDAVYSGGMNPWDSAESSKYPLDIAFSAYYLISLISIILYL